MVFHIVSTPEPHASQRAQMLKKYPKIAQLQGPEPLSKYLCLALIVGQLWLSVVVPHMSSWPGRILVTYGLGATLTQALFLAIHELSHNLFFHTPRWNRWFAMVANLPLCVPFALAFREHHMRHHAAQGTWGKDADLPTQWEARWLLAPHWTTRLIWLSLQIVAYAVRPLVTDPLAVPLSRELVVSWAVQAAANWVWYRIFGWDSLVYLSVCVVLAGGLHPCAGHFVAEHYDVHHTQKETFSYYGPLNWVAWNVGYHNEHHDFPRIPWSRLPRLTRLAHGHYGALPTCPSWTRSMLAFVRHGGVRTVRKETIAVSVVSRTTRS